MAAFSSHEDEILVELIAINPSLYDGRLPSYRDTIVRENIWEEIAKRLNKTSNECKKRWKYIRDSYSRCKRKSKSASKITKWMLFERLRFLDNIPTEKTSTSTVQDENIEGETNEETSAGKSELKRSSEETSEGLTSNEGTSGAGIDTAGISGLRSEDRNEEGTSIEGTSGTEIGTREVGKKGRKRKSENIHTSLHEYWKERDIERHAQMRTVTAHAPGADVDGIDTFCAHMGSVLKQLPPGLRVEAKTKLFKVLSEFEMKSLEQRSRRSNVSFSPNSNESFPAVTEPTCHIEEDPNYLFISD